MIVSKKSVRDLPPYEVKQRPYLLKLDANEGKNIFAADLTAALESLKSDPAINLYPDSDSRRLRLAMGNYLCVNPENIVVGNGSSEMIELIMKAFVDRDDPVLSFEPTFGMYARYCKIYGGQFVGLASKEDFTWDLGVMIKKAQAWRPKIIFLCNPNNPTGGFVVKASVKELLDAVSCPVVVDEAYAEFATDSLVREVDMHKNLIVLRTWSKALGLAAIRLGCLVANRQITAIINRIKAPYNLNGLSQHIGARVLDSKEKISAYVAEVKKERQFLFEGLNLLAVKPYPSQGNFIFFHALIDNLAKKLAEQGILIRDYGGSWQGYYRVTVGERWENQKFLEALEGLINDEKGKIATKNP